MSNLANIRPIQYADSGKNLTFWLCRRLTTQEIRAIMDVQGVVEVTTQGSRIQVYLDKNYYDSTTARRLIWNIAENAMP